DRPFSASQMLFEGLQFSFGAVMSDLIAFAFQDMLGPSPGNSHAVQQPSQIVRLPRHARPPLQEFPQPRQGPRGESITQLSGRGENRLPPQFQMLHLQAARST